MWGDALFVILIKKGWHGHCQDLGLVSFSISSSLLQPKEQ
jgi:hypothetical protein